MRRLAPTLAFIVSLLLGVARPLPATAQGATVDPAVWTALAGGGSIDLLVRLRAAAPVAEAAERAPDAEARAAAVAGALRQTAAASQAPLLARLRQAGAAPRAYWVANVVAVRGDRALVSELAQRSDVAAIEPDQPVRVPLAQDATRVTAAPAAIEWNVAYVNAPALWSLGVTGQNIVIAGADTGILWTHPALQSRYRGWNGTTADHNYNWWDAIRSDLSGNGTNAACGFAAPAPCDDQGHGTHTLGTAVGDDGAGNQIGVAPGARWIGCRNMDEGVGRPSSYIECLQFFLAPTDLNGNNPDPARRPNVVVNSYTCPPVELCNSGSLTAAVESLRAAGIFMAVAAGNDGPACATATEPPSNEPSAVTVGALAFQSDTIASFSSRGPAGAVRKPDLVAPGSSIRSAYLGGGYALLSGTSMATPHVAGAVALLWSAYPTLTGNLTATTNLLTASAVPLTTGQGCGGDGPAQVPNNVYGYGRLNIQAAYQLLGGLRSRVYLAIMGR